MANGLIYSRSLTGNRPVLREYSVVPDSNHTYAAGDLVTLDSTGRLIQVTASSTANVLGVIDSVYGARNNPLEPRKQLTFNQPTRGPFLTSGQTGVALVNVDPDALYVAEIDVTASIGLAGQTVHVSGSPSVNTRTGRGQLTLRGASLGTGAENPLQIVGISPAQDILGIGIDNAAGTNVEVKINAARKIFGPSAI